MNAIQIPITNQPNQSFSMNLPLDTNNIQLDFFVYWNRIAGYWQISIAQNGIDLLVGLPVLNGEDKYIDLLGQYSYLNIGRLIVVPISNTANDSPGIADWGNNFILVWTS